MSSAFVGYKAKLKRMRARREPRSVSEKGLVLSILEGRGPTRGTLAARETSVAMAVDQELPVAHSGTTRGGKIFTELVLRKKNTEGN